VPHIFAIGGIVGQPMLAHKAVHEAHVAVEVIAGELQGNKELATAALNARAIANGRYEGVTKLLFDDPPQALGHGKILGGGMFGTRVGDMIGEIARAIEIATSALIATQ
jgi:dihydrolipoamide dehydrogenase